MPIGSVQTSSKECLSGEGKLVVHVLHVGKLENYCSSWLLLTYLNSYHDNEFCPKTKPIPCAMQTHLNVHIIR